MICGFTSPAVGNRGGKTAPWMGWDASLLQQFFFMAGSGGADREEPVRRACPDQVSKAGEKALQRNGAGKATEGVWEC